MQLFSKNLRRALVAAIARDPTDKFLGAQGVVLDGITKPEIAKALKALVWFWLINETYWTNPMSMCVDEIGLSKSGGR